MLLIDSHAHIYDTQFDEDRDEVIQNCISNGIKKILMPNCAQETIESMFMCEQKYPNICLAMMGLHPCYVKQNFDEELNTVEQYLLQRKFIALGEIGLDYYWDITFKQEQITAFNKQIELAIHYNLPIVIHSRESTEDCIKIVRQYKNTNLKGVFHCYSGSLVQAQKIIELGFYLGIGGVLTYKKTNLTEIVTQVPKEFLILETDAPYLSPVPFRGKRNSPAYTKIVSEKLAEILNTSLTDIATFTTQNCVNLFGSELTK